MAAIRVTETYGRPSSQDLLRKVNIEEDIQEEEPIRGGAMCVMRKTGEKVALQFGFKYLQWGPRMDLVSEEERRPALKADKYVFVHMQEGHGNDRIIIGGKFFTYKEVLNYCKTEKLRYDKAADKYFVSWTQLK